MKPWVIQRYIWRPLWATAENNSHLLASVPLHFSMLWPPDNHYLLLPNQGSSLALFLFNSSAAVTVNHHPQTPSNPVFCANPLSWFSCELLAKFFVHFTSSLPSSYLSGNVPQGPRTRFCFSSALCVEKLIHPYNIILRLMPPALTNPLPSGDWHQLRGHIYGEVLPSLQTQYIQNLTHHQSSVTCFFTVYYTPIFLGIIFHSFFFFRTSTQSISKWVIFSLKCFLDLFSFF